MSSFLKFDLKGKNVHGELQKICTANIKNEIGKSTYTQMLNNDGGIETDLTMICMDKDYFRIVTSAANREHDKFHIQKYLSKDINFEDVTDKISCFGIFGPKSRDLISNLSKDNLSNENLKNLETKCISIKGINIWVQRLSYVVSLVLSYMQILKMQKNCIRK